MSLHVAQTATGMVRSVRDERSEANWRRFSAAMCLQETADNHQDAANNSYIITAMEVSFVESANIIVI